MRFYIDTEFDESRTTLISLGVVSQDGREFYAVNHSYDRSLMSDWLRENVTPHLFEVVPKGGDILQHDDIAIARKLSEFVDEATSDTEPEFYGYKSAWDIVLVHKLFGSGYQGVLAMESRVPLVCFDICQMGLSLGIKSLKDLVKPFTPEHNALVDARWTKHVHEHMIVQFGREL